MSACTCEKCARSLWTRGCNEQPDSGPTVGELCVVFLEHAKSRSTKAGKATSEICLLKACLRPLNGLYGRTPAAEFGPLALKAVRGKMIALGTAPVL